MSTSDEYRYDEAPHVCEAHPLKAWPHQHEGEDCPGPGVAMTRAQLLPPDPRIGGLFTVKPHGSLEPGHGVLVEAQINIQAIDVVFDGPPSHESGRFVEVEDLDGRSMSVGEWIDRGDGLWALRINRVIVIN